MKVNRRSFLAATAAGTTCLAAKALARPVAAPPAEIKRKFLIVLGCTGGASIIDSFMAISDSEVLASGGDPSTLNCFQQSQLIQIDGTPFRAVDIEQSFRLLGGFSVNSRQSEFVRKHMKHCQVVTQEVSSVNHAVAETRSITGAGAWRGRTLQECVAMTYGDGLPLPNLDMGAGGFRFASGDAELPDFAAPSFVTDPLYWAFGLSAIQGASHGVKSPIFEAARRLRDDAIDGSGKFLRAHSEHSAVKKWLNDRGDQRRLFESGKLIERVFLRQNRPGDMSPDAEMKRIFEIFPNIESDELEAQAALAYLAITRGLSCAVTIAPSFAAAGEDLQNIRNPPLAFDFSHQDHRTTQAHMWQRMMSVADRLVTLLSEKNIGDNTSFWDHSLIYFATDFGRDKTRPRDAVEFSTGHHLNNGSLLMSPMLRGNTVLGGVDPKTGLTFGFDLATGEPKRGQNAGEREVFAGILQTLGVDTGSAGLPDVRAMRRKT